VSEPVWCWCCATWGLSVPAVSTGRLRPHSRLCERCLNSSPAACKNRHMAEALRAGQEPQKPPGAVGHGHE